MPSGASSASRPSSTYFLDRQIGRYTVAAAMRAAGAAVEIHDDHFGPLTDDLVWIPQVAARNWVLITLDQNIRRNPLQRAAYKAAALKGFILTGHGMNGVEIARLLVACLPRMTRRVASAKGPLLYTISRFGSFTQFKV